MKIYTITLALLAYSTALVAFSPILGMPANPAVDSFVGEDIGELMPADVTYSDSDIGMYIYGDFLKMLATLAKLFAYAPAIASQSLAYIGVPAALIALIKVGLYVTYVTGIVQILGKFAIQGAE